MSRTHELHRRRFGALLVGTALVGYVAAASAATYGVSLQPIPGVTEAGVTMDYIAFDPATHLLWVPAGNTGQVVVVDTTTGTARQIQGLPTTETGTGDHKRVLGPSSATVGEGLVYVGNRGDSTVCAFDSRSLEKKGCHRLDSMPDGLAYVTSLAEVWVTTPRDKSIRVLDGKTLAEKARVSLDGNPEGFAVDSKHGRFYTNLEDKDKTLSIDLKTHKAVATWPSSCGKDGPHGLRIDAEARHLFVACSSLVKVLDVSDGGTVLSSVETGDGVDDIDFTPGTRLLYVGAAKAGQLTVARADAHGKLSIVAKVATPVGARNPAVTDKGTVYLAHSSLGGLTDLVVVAPKE